MAHCQRKQACQALYLTILISFVQYLDSKSIYMVNLVHYERNLHDFECEVHTQKYYMYYLQARLIVKLIKLSFMEIRLLSGIWGNYYRNSLKIIKHSLLLLYFLDIWMFSLIDFCIQRFRPAENAGVWVNSAGAHRAKVSPVSTVPAQDGQEVSNTHLGDRGKLYSELDNINNLVWKS